MKMRYLTTVAASLAAGLLAATNARADYSSQVLSFHPPAYWRLNETVQPPAPDLATNIGALGSAATAFYVGSVAHPVTGALPGSTDTAATFNGSTAAAVLPFSSALAFDGPFTAEAWVQPGTAPAGLTSVLSCGQLGNPRYGWLIYQDIGGYNFRTYNGNGQNTAVSIEGGPEPQLGTWYHVVAIYDGTNAYLYVNGVLSASQAPVTASPRYVPNPNGPLTIGTRSDKSFYFNGSVDEVAIYTNALSAATILAHYQNGTNASPGTPYQQLVLAQNPLVYFRLGEPAYTPPDPTALPTATNYGTLTNTIAASYEPGCTPGVSGVPYSGMGSSPHACRFNGNAGYVGSPDNAVALDFLGSVSIAAWVKGDAANGAFQCSAGKGDGSYRLAVDGSGLPHFAEDGNADVTGPQNINDGLWHLMVGVYESELATNYLYVDGALVASGSAASAPGGSLNPFTIGTAPDYLNGRIYYGSIAEVAIFTNALSGAQIQQLFQSANVPPRITEQPQSPAGPLYEGSTVTLNVAAVGSPTLAYQWTKGGSALTGQTKTSLVLSGVTTNGSGDYAVVITNSFGSVTSSIVALAIQTGPPLILREPQSITRYQGTAASFSVQVGGSAPLSYQWYKGSSTLSTATNSSYTIVSVQLTNAGNYSCTITNPFGSTNTIVATLDVITVTNAYALAVLADGPMAYWRLGETNGTVAHDYINSHDGQYTNVTLGVPGDSVIDSDPAAGFGPGINSYVGGIQGINFATNANGAFSLEAWVKGGPQMQIGDVGIIAKGAGAGGEQFNLDTGNGGAYRFFIRDSTGGTDGGFGSSIKPDNTWQHLVAVCDQPAGQLYLYVNGAQAGSHAAPAGGVLSSSDPVSIGSRRSGSGTPYDLNWVGSIDEVAVYNYPLSPSQVQAHYAARYGTTTPPVILTQPASVTNYQSVPAVFTVDAGGTAPLSYQWQFNGGDIPGAISNSWTVMPLDFTNAGNYTVILVNPVNTITSTVARLTVVAAPTAIDLSSGLVLRLKFDSDYLDYSGRGNNGTNVGATTLVAGKIGAHALHFVTAPSFSVYDYVDLGVRPDLQFSSNVNFSVAFWVQLPAGSLPGDLPFLCNAPNSTFSFGYVFAPTYQTGGWAWSLYDASAGVGVYGANNSINDGDWHQLTHTFDRAGYAITYLDGLQVDMRPLASRFGSVDTGQPTRIGQDPTGTYGVDGEASLDDLGVWRRVLSPAEAAAMYAAGKVNGQSFVSAPVRLNIQSVSGNRVTLTWAGGILQSADQVNGAYGDVTGATSPYTPAATGTKFYRVRQ